MKYLIACISMLICIPAFAQQNSDAVKIGIIADLSGHGAFWGKQTEIGVRLAEKELRANGNKISVVFGDSAYKTTTAISEAQKMLFSDNVDAIITEFTPIVHAVSPVVKNANKLFYGSCGSAAFIESNSYAFKSFVDYKNGCIETARIWKQHGIKTPALLRLKFEHGENCKDGVKEVFGEIPEFMFDPGETLSSHVLMLKSKKVDGIIFVGGEQDSINLSKALKAIRYFPAITTQYDDIAALLKQKDSNKLESEILTFGFTPISKNFIDKILEIDPNNQPMARSSVAIAYLAVLHLYETISQCPKDDINCQVQKMAESEPNELLSFKGYKNRIADFTYQYVSWKGGKPTVIK